jgi:hypothetical protein
MLSSAKQKYLLDSVLQETVTRSSTRFDIANYVKLDDHKLIALISNVDSASHCQTRCNDNGNTSYLLFKPNKSESLANGVSQVFWGRRKLFSPLDTLSIKFVYGKFYMSRDYFHGLKHKYLTAPRTKGCAGICRGTQVGRGGDQEPLKQIIFIYILRVRRWSECK